VTTGTSGRESKLGAECCRSDWAAGAADRQADTNRFGSREAVERTGNELVAVEERPMVSEVVAGGVVRSDERRVAQLSARVPGSVWRVEKHLGDPVRVASFRAVSWHWIDRHGKRSNLLRGVLDRSQTHPMVGMLDHRTIAILGLVNDGESAHGVGRCGEALGPQGTIVHTRMGKPGNTDPV
jgi:hypothetical protein